MQPAKRFKVAPLAIVALLLVLEISGMVGVQFAFGRDPFTPAELQYQDLMRSNATNDRLVFAPYSYAYDNETGLNVRSGSIDILTDHPENNGSGLAGFSWANASWHAYEISQMAAAKIDVCLPVYSGNPADHAWAIGGLDAMVGGYNQLLAAGYLLKDLPKIAMFLNVSSLYQDEIAHGKVELMTVENQERFAAAIIDFYSHVPDQYRFQYHNNSNNYIVWLDNDTSWVGHVKDYFLTNVTQLLNQTNPFGNFTFVASSTWVDAGLLSLAGVYQWGAAMTGPTVLDRPGVPILCVGPGFDNTGAVRAGYESALQLKDRQAGTFYNSSWEYVFAKSPSWVLLQSWNNLNEGSGISPTLEYGDTYVNLTRNNVETFKSLPPVASDVILLASFAITDRMLVIVAVQMTLAVFLGLTLYLAFMKFKIHNRSASQEVGQPLSKTAGNA